MNEFTGMRGTARGTTIPNYADTNRSADLQVNQRGELIVAQGLPPLAELVRQGGSWQIIGAATAALTAVPTTTAGHSLWNGEADTGKCYVIDSFGAVEIVVDATQQNGLAMFASMEAGKFTAPTDAGLVKASLSGRTASQTNARTVAGATVAGVWTPHGPAAAGASAVAGGAWRVTECKPDGLYVVRPGGLFSIHCAKIAATASQIRFFIRWHEVQMGFAS